MRILYKMYMNLLQKAEYMRVGQFSYPANNLRSDAICMNLLQKAEYTACGSISLTQRLFEHLLFFEKYTLRHGLQKRLV